VKFEPQPIGEWRVERVSGLLPPFGISKSIRRAGGVTRVAGLPLAPFRLVDRTLVYTLLPVRDELSRLPDGSWEGRGVVLGREFCRFRLRRR
jgi:hypothetical protein